MWRARWEQTREQVWKDKLLTYNAEDCAALKKVTEFVQAVGEAARSRGAEVATDPVFPARRLGGRGRQAGEPPGVLPAKFAIQDFDHVNRCAYFDYQREKVFLRTSKAVRRACLRLRKRKPRPKATREVEIKDDACPHCKGTRITRLREKTHAKLAYDLKFTRGGIRRQVIRCKAAWHWCEDCQRRFPARRDTRGGTSTCTG